MIDATATAQTILVVGAEISGITSALEAAEAGKRVVLLERLPFIGGRITQWHKYFPKLCPPSCGFEINLRRITGFYRSIQVILVNLVNHNFSR